MLDLNFLLFFIHTKLPYVLKKSKAVTQYWSKTVTKNTGLIYFKIRYYMCIVLTNQESYTLPH